jgi:hypothetical protein
MAVTEPFVWGPGGAQMTPESIAAQRKIAQAMMQRGSDYSPVQSAWQGAARVAEGLMGGLDARMADTAEQKNAASERELLASLISGGTGAAAAPAVAAPMAAPAPAVAAPVAPPGTDQAVYPAPAEPPPAPTTFRPGITAPTGDAASAIAAIESGGKYDKLGPVTRTGDRAYGKYQVMGANVPQWTRTHLGQEMTPEQFLASPEAQDAVFKGQFGQYANKYGPEGAARAWFAGEGGMNNPNAKDQLGTSVAAYAQKFNQGYKPPDPAAVPPNAQPAQGFAVPGQPAQPSPAVARVAQAMPGGMNPKLVAAMASPYTSEGTKKILGIMLQSQLQGEGVTTADAGNKIIIMDKRGNVVRELAKGEPNKGPEFGVIGKDEFGNEQYGWRDPRTQSTTPAAKPQATTPAQPSTIPAAPPGVDPKVWREGQSKRATEEGMPASGDVTSKLRNEIQGLPSYKNLAQAAPVYRAMNEAAGRDNRAADLNLIYGFGKIMDPGSVVRESEMTMAEKINTLPQYLRATAESQLSGSGRLSPEVRAQILAEAHTRIQSYKGMFDQDAGMYRGIAKRGRMNEEDVIPNFGEFTPWTPPKTSAPVEIDGYKIKAK